MEGGMARPSPVLLLGERRTPSDCEAEGNTNLWSISHFRTVSRDYVAAGESENRTLLREYSAKNNHSGHFRVPSPCFFGDDQSVAVDDTPDPNSIKRAHGSTAGVFQRTDWR